MCKVGTTQGMCVKNDLVQSLCIPLGFKAIQKDCTPNFMCCFNAGTEDSGAITETAADQGVDTSPVTPAPSIPRSV
jgi:hypothetical protein